MNAEFFALAFLAALNPKLLALDLLLIGIPGASYLTALHNLVTGRSSTAIQVIAVAVFVLIDFLLIIIPFAFLELRPEATKALLKRTQDWLLGLACSSGRHRLAPGRLPCRQRPGPAELMIAARGWV